MSPPVSVSASLQSIMPAPVVAQLLDLRAVIVGRSPSRSPGSSSRRGLVSLARLARGFFGARSPRPGARCRPARRRPERPRRRPGRRRGLGVAVPSAARRPPAAASASAAPSPSPAGVFGLEPPGPGRARGVGRGRPAGGFAGGAPGGCAPPARPRRERPPRGAASAGRGRPPRSARGLGARPRAAASSASLRWRSSSSRAARSSASRRACSSASLRARSSSAGTSGALDDDVADRLRDERAGADRVVVARDHVVDAVRVAVGVDQADDRDPQALGLAHGDHLGLEVDDEHRVGRALHVLDAAEVGLELREVGLGRQRSRVGSSSSWPSVL